RERPARERPGTAAGRGAVNWPGMKVSRAPRRARARAAAGLTLTAAALTVAARADATVDIAGIDDALAANVRAYLRLDDEPCDALAWRVEQQYRAAPQQIREALQAYGYYEPTIETTFERDDRCWHVTLT